MNNYSMNNMIRSSRISPMMNNNQYVIPDRSPVIPNETILHSISETDVINNEYEQSVKNSFEYKCVLCIWKILGVFCCVKRKSQTSPQHDSSDFRLLTSINAYENISFLRNSNVSESLELDNLGMDDVVYFSLRNIQKIAKIVWIYDGICFVLLFKHFDKIYKWNCKLNNIEFKYTSGKTRNERHNLRHIKHILNKLLFNKICKITCFDFDNENFLNIDIELPENMLDCDEPNNLCDWLVYMDYARMK